MAIVSNAQKQIIETISYQFLCRVVVLFGMVANVINLCVFYKQGLKSSINITFFAMAISDFCGLVTQEWLNICYNPLFEAADLPIVPIEFQFLTAAVPRVMFAKITCLITVYATLERCLCIASPLKVKQMITPRKTTIVMICIYGLSCLSLAPLYDKIHITWKFYPERNKTLLGVVFSSDSQKVTEVVIILLAFVGLVSFIAVVILTIILIRKLAEKSAWRSLATKSESMTNRDKKTMTLIALIASILILSYTPDLFLNFTTFVEPEFAFVGEYSNLYCSLWSFGILFESVNASVNIFLYMKMSTEYRNTFFEMFHVCSAIRKQ